MHVPIESIRNNVSTKAIAKFGSYTMLFPPSMLIESSMIDVIAEPMAVPSPRENNINLSFFVNGPNSPYNYFVVAVYRIYVSLV